MSGATTANTKTVTTNVSPALTAVLLTNLLSLAPENMTIAQMKTLLDAVGRGPLGSNPASLIGACLP
jgi:hypothetical protein